MGSIFSESFQVAETLCWLEKSNSASSSLADCVVDHRPGDNITVANASHSCSPGYIQFTEITQLLVEFIVVKDHLSDGVFFLLDDQALITDKGLSMQMVWQGADTLTGDVPYYLVQN